MTSLLNTRLLSLSIATALGLAASVHAQTFDAPISVLVRFADLDINHAPGSKIMLGRVEAAATRACGGEPDIRDLGRRAVYLTCRASTIDRALKELGSGVVTAAANKRSGNAVLAGQ